MGDYQGAIADYDKAIERNPRFAVAYNNRGNAKSTLEDHQGAIADYDKAIKFNPKYAKAYKNRGIAKNALGDMEGAKKDFDKAAELDRIADATGQAPRIQM